MRTSPAVCLVLSAFCAIAPQADATESDFASSVTTKQISTLFPKGAVSNVNANWPLLQTELKHFGLTSKEAVIYTLATIRVETGVFSPDPERASKFSRTVDKPGYAGIQASGTVRPYGAYDSTMRFKKDGSPVVNKGLGNCYYRGVDEALMRARQGMPPLPECDDGERYRGRGFVQLTGKYNYEQMQKQVGALVGVDIVAQPEKASDPAVAAKIIAAYLSLKKADIETDMAADRLADARKLVNAAGLGLTEFTAFVAAARKSLK